VLHCLAHFPPERLLFGGDWPVCSLSAPLGAWLACCEALLNEAGLSDESQAWIWSKSAQHVYRIDLSSAGALEIG